jgi:apolipoprotein D and lipocalin family protein
LQTVPQVDLPRYMGDWYVIANIPYFAEKDCYDSIESYALARGWQDRQLVPVSQEVLRCPARAQGDAIATVEDKTSNAVWSVRFFHLISVKYLILDLDPAISGSRWGIRRAYGWIMARSKTLDGRPIRAFCKGLSEQGYDPGEVCKGASTALRRSSGRVELFWD